ncbi:UDP-3-O-(3-hydroxymyristoyl)glucosamine N-acyltransferase [Clostridium sp.]|uniref:UDP-3-O-(3-hydroxymyristoyl)glucosamine N-acyltransferase n=1 Tax=Clostridium sp. TaxID=1506 RepID=UPI0029076185|nr:UDP-3-O-(3-hydroxymyristoyl)glucosamine N-acyltransferase [Clostridium sp.]MDU5108192.1 UDP-3-O-(3-hydroxymyristoyl)glucosamine N-acyltransferase [Clostridium sp.]
MIKVREIIESLDYKDFILNKEIMINGFQTLSDSMENKVLFIKKFDRENIEKIQNFRNCLIILSDKYKSEVNNNENAYIFVESPRFEFARVGNFLLSRFNKEVKYIDMGNYTKSDNCEIENDVIIEPYVFIGNNVKIGSGTIVMTGAKIRDNVTIGENCIIRENCVVGGYGFGLEKDYEGNNYRIPHVGGVVIEDNVEIGALTTVCSGTIKPTMIKKYAKIDDHVHIAHNCIIEENCIVTACAEVSGSVRLGKNCWLAPNTSIINGITIGDNCTIGMGSVVTKALERNKIVVGPMAEELEEAKKFVKIKKRLLNE